jgi:tetratricopeptide (TPR) repeat protein
MMLIGAAFGMGIYTWRVAQARTEELRRLEYVEELVQLRRWPEAAVVLQRMLSEPMRTPQARIQALVYLASVLGRFQRYQDAVTVQEYLLAHVAMDDSASHALRCARAMGMLHEDRLVDADRAINELRRSGGGAAASSAGLALVELYRDVKTGHPAEAIQTFRDRLPQMCKQLGHRVAEAWALAARAYDMVGQTQLAAEAYANASALAPIADISRRYAEVAALTGRYPATAAPAE